MKVTREDIQNAAKKYFRKDNRVTLHYVPKKADQPNLPELKEDKK